MGKNQTMKIRNIVFFIIAGIILFSCSTPNENKRIVQKIDQNWRFHLGDVPEAIDPDFNDGSWRKLNLPHDWAIELPIDSTNPSGKAGGFVQGGIGIYRKHLDIPMNYQDKRIYLKFDGIYRNSDIWLNGEHIGQKPYGYVSHYYDVTDVARPGKKNVITVCADNAFQPSDRWYSGFGIYRHVWLIVTGKVHIPIWGTYITTPQVNKEKATVKIETEINNMGENDQEITLLTEIFDPENNKVAENEKSLSVNSINITKAVQEIEVAKPEMWDVYQPAVYRVKSTIKTSGQVADVYESTFGIRTIEFSPEKGFVLNGKQVKMKGVNLHHDGGCLGAAVPAAVWDYRLEVLKSLGVNAIRTSHNPAMEELVTLCDQKGILVFDEINDKWGIPWLNWRNPDDTAFVEMHKQTFYDHYLEDLALFVDRDKNHPSVVIWSIGNETLEQLIDVKAGKEIVDNMVSWIHENEPTRKVTCGMHPGNDKENEVPTSFLHHLDVLSYNYRTHQFKDWKKEYPDLICIASETKQYNNHWADKSVLNSLDFSGNSWWHVDEGFICGQYIWAGIDYLGESAGWPDKGLNGCILYSNAFPKANAWFTQSIYDENPMVKLAVWDEAEAESMRNQTTWQISWWPAPLASHWNWAGKEGEKLDVAVFTNCESAELYLNDELLGEKQKEDFQDGVLRWEVPFTAGTLKAIAKNNGNHESEHELVTAKAPAKIALDPFKSEITTDNDDASVIQVHVVDENGNTCPLANNLVEFSIQGPGIILGVDNGDMADHYDWKGKSVKGMNGKAIVVVQSDGNSGEIKLMASSNGLEGAEIKVSVKE